PAIHTYGRAYPVPDLGCRNSVLCFATWPRLGSRGTLHQPQRRRASRDHAPARRTVKKAWQAAWLLRAVTCLDLTTLQGDDTPGNVRRLCAKARQPVRREILERLGAEQLPIAVGAVCVYHNLTEPTHDALQGSA